VQRSPGGKVHRTTAQNALQRAEGDRPPRPADLLLQQDGITVTVLSFDIADDRITHIWAMRNPGSCGPWMTG
jgi:hypothetical protein